MHVEAERVVTRHYPRSLTLTNDRTKREQYVASRVQSNVPCLMRTSGIILLTIEREHANEDPTDP